MKHWKLKLFVISLVVDESSYIKLFCYKSGGWGKLIHALGVI